MDEQKPSEPVSQPQTPTATPAKKSSSTTLIVVIVIIIVVLAAGGYFAKNYLARKAGEKIAEGIISAGTDGKVKVDTSNNTVKVTDGNTSTTISDTTKWPTDLPEGAPKYSGGTVKTVSKTTTPESWAIAIDDTTQAQFTAYKSAVEAAGWTTAYQADATTSSVGSYTKATWTLNATFDTSSGAYISIMPTQ